MEKNYRSLDQHEQYVTPRGTAGLIYWVLGLVTLIFAHMLGIFQ